MITLNQVEINGVVHDIGGPNPNLLINSNFANPVNQRGEDTKTTAGYWIDRWNIYAYGDNEIEATINRENHSIILKSLVEYDTDHYEFCQLIDRDDLKGSDLTFSLKLKGYNEIINTSATIPTEYQAESSTRVYGSYTHISGVKIAIGKMTYTDKIFVGVSLPYKVSVELEWAKLEFGNAATPYIPRLYKEEFQLCQWYYTVLDVRSATLNQIDESILKLTLSPVPEMRINGPSVVLVARIKVMQGTNASYPTFTVNYFYKNIKDYERCGYVSFMSTDHDLVNTLERPIRIEGVIALDAEL